MLARRSKVDPLSDCPLGDGWNVVELDLDGKMSAVSSLTKVKPGLLVPQRDLS